jgi:hypothetical protein
MAHIPDLLPNSAEWDERVKIYKRRWNGRNTERHREQTAAWRERNPDKVSDFQRNVRERREKLRSLPLSDERGRKHRQASMFHDAKKRAKRDGLAFDLTKEDILIPATCPVFGFEFTHTPGRRTDRSPSLDRINNERGYIRGNVIVVSWLANRLKSDATVEQLRIVVNFYGSCQTSSPDL